MDHLVSLLDNDFYKFTMMQAIFHNYSDVEVEYKFKNRDTDMQMPDALSIIMAIQEWDNLSFSNDEINYLRNIRFFKPGFIAYLSRFKFNSSYIVECKNIGNDLSIRIKGPWLETILYEVPILSLISSMIFKRQYLEGIKCNKISGEFAKFTDEKYQELLKYNGSGFKFTDFGTRRRSSFDYHEFMISIFSNSIKLAKGTFIGTSNVLLAKRYGVKCIGTMAHEWLQAHQALGVRLQDSQKQALEVWVKEYRGDLGIALTDVISMDAFLSDFDLYFAKLFDGCRHDSSDPYIWCEKLIRHYEKLGINPKTKMAIFSDSLDFNKAIDLHNTFNKFINVSAGIGTFLTYLNIENVTRPPKIVMKMVKCNGQDVAKLSDDLGKGMCENIEYEKSLKNAFNII